MANQGNDAEGVILTSIEGRSFGIDAAGNLVLNTALTAPATPSRGAPGIVGAGLPYNLAISNAAGASANLANLALQVQDILGNPVAGSFVFDLWLSDSAAGIGLTATTPSGGIAALANSGAILDVGTTSKSVRVQTNASGLMTLVITDTAKTAFYPVASLIPGMPVVVGARLTTASYHS